MPEEYKAFAEVLSHQQLPLHLLLGNHDNRGNFQAAFPKAKSDENGFVQSIVDTDQGRLIFLDTLMEGTSAGWHCKDRMNILIATTSIQVILEIQSSLPLSMRQLASSLINDIARGSWCHDPARSSEISRGLNPEQYGA